MTDTLTTNDRLALQAIAKAHPTSIMAFARTIWPRFTAKSKTTPGRRSPSIDNIRGAAASILRGLMARDLVSRPTGSTVLAITPEGRRLLDAATTA